MQTQNLAVGYARVSFEGEDIGNQMHAIEDYAKANNLTLVGVFKDIGVSGARPAMERDGLKQLLTALEFMTVLFDLLGFCFVVFMCSPCVGGIVFSTSFSFMPYYVYSAL
jgi:hypothetical protein